MRLVKVKIYLLVYDVNSHNISIEKFNLRQSSQAILNLLYSKHTIYHKNIQNGKKVNKCRFCDVT